MTTEPTRVQRLVAALAYEYQRDQHQELQRLPRRRPELREFVDITPYADLSDEQVARKLGVKGSEISYVVGWIADERAGLLGGPEGRCEAGTKRWGWLRCHRPALPSERWCGHHHPTSPTPPMTAARLDPRDLAARPDGAVLQALYELTDQQRDLARAVDAALSRVDRVEERQAEHPPELLTVTQAAELLAVSRRSVYRMCHEHRLPWLRVGREYRFRSRDLEKWLTDRTIRRVR